MGEMSNNLTLANGDVERMIKLYYPKLAKDNGVKHQLLLLKMAQSTLLGIVTLYEAGEYDVEN